MVKFSYLQHFFPRISFLKIIFFSFQFWRVLQGFLLIWGEKRGLHRGKPPNFSWERVKNGIAKKGKKKKKLGGLKKQGIFFGKLVSAQGKITFYQIQDIKKKKTGSFTNGPKSLFFKCFSYYSLVLQNFILK